MGIRRKGCFGAAIRGALLVLLCVALAGARAKAGALTTIAPACVGDCNHNGSVTVDEILTMVNIALTPETVSITLCNAGDQNIDDKITVDEILTAVNNALTPSSGCGAMATATPTASPSPTPSQPMGNQAVKGSSRLPLVTMESTIDIVDFGYIAPSSAQTLSGSRITHRYRLASREPVSLVQRIDPSSETLITGTVDTSCSGAVVNCSVNDNASTLSVAYTNCTTSTDAGHRIVRDGTVTQTVGSPTFCETRTIPATATVTLTLNNFRLVETDASKVQVASVSATAVTDSFIPGDSTCTSADGSTVVSGTETITGTQTIECHPSAQSLECPPGGRNLTLTGNGLILTRLASGSPCQLRLMLNGELTTQNRLLNESLVSTFRDFTMTETKATDGSSLVSVNGRIHVDCLGDLQFVDTAPIAFDGVNACPTSGRVKAYVCAAAPAVYGPDNLAFQVLLRAENGQAYQLLGGGGCVLPTFDTRITTVAGAIGDVQASAIVLSNTACPEGSVGAAAVAAPQCDGTVIPVNDVVKFGPVTQRIGFFPVGNGLLCVGNEGASIADGMPIGLASPGLPAATLATSTGFEPCIGSTFAFGAMTPTTNACFQQPPPADGFLLTPGTAVVFAYNTTPEDTVGMGAAGFCVDRGTNTVRAGGGRRDGLVPPPPVPSVSYNSGGTAFDFDGDGNIDETVPSCADASLILCH